MRWFAPVDCGWGSLIRHIFSAGSYPQMFAFDHPWGGSTAIKADGFCKYNLKARWGKTPREDSGVHRPVRELGLKLVWVPAATNINPESINFQASLRFVQRQLLCVRLDHVDWPVLLACNLFNVVSVLVLLVLAGVGIGMERWDWLGLGVGLIAAFAVTMYAALTTREGIICRTHSIRGLAPPPTRWGCG